MIQRLSASAVDGKMGLSWFLVADTKAVSISVAHDKDFTMNPRSFVVPPIQSILLDVGPGTWWVRVGGWDGTEQEGRIDWTFASKPVAVTSTTPLIKEQEPTLSVVHTQAIQGGVRFHTSNGPGQPVWVLLETSTDPRFPAFQTKTRYAYDWGRGNVDCMGLQVGTLYSVRLHTFFFPTKEVQQVSKGLVSHRLQPAKPLRLSSATDTTVRRGDIMLLRDAKEQPNLKFPSHTVYLKYKAATAKTVEDKKPV